MPSALFDNEIRNIDVHGQGVPRVGLNDRSFIRNYRSEIVDFWFP
jgi:hypothetical protein